MTAVPEECRLSVFCLQWLFPHSWYLLQRYSLSVYFCTEKTSISNRRDVYLNISMFTQKDCPHNGGHIHVIHPILFSLYQLLQSHCTLVCTGMIRYSAFGLKVKSERMWHAPCLLLWMSGRMNLILPSEAKWRISANPREFNVINKGLSHKRRIILFAHCGSPFQITDYSFFC